MAVIVLFHHVQGLTPGVIDFAERLQTAGHTAYTPDLFDGQTFTTLEAGMDYARSVGFNTILGKGVASVAALGPDLVYAGLSMGVMPAQKLVQTRPGARGALFFDACLPVDEFGDGWPHGVPAQIHGMADDPFFAEDLEAARELVDSVENAELFTYRGDRHLFVDSSLSSFDGGATDTVIRRVIDFLSRID